MWGLINVGLALLSVSSGVLVQAQTAQHAQCNPGFEWSFNTKAQSPCAVSEALGGVCNGGVFTVPPLAVDQVYRGPDPSAANSCRCSMVFYAMTSTCAACQSRSWITWSQYNTNCTNVYVGFPQTIPSGTAVPHYAYQNFTATDKFDITIAQNDSGPESVAPSGTSGGSGSNGTSAPTTSGGSNAGAIAGGVVGGVVGAGIIGGLIAFFLIRRRRNAQRKASPDVNLVDPLTQEPMAYAGANGYPSTPPPKLYDPSDPSTFPSSPALSGSDVYTAPSGVQPFGYTPSPPPLQPTPQPVTRTGYYSGAPEV